MRRVVSRMLVAAAAVTGGAVLWVASSLPPHPAAAVGERAVTDLPVAYHVHTRRSDGTGSVATVAAAARRAGLAAVVLTDHGDGTRATEAPRYVDGVLIIDAVEVSTWAGHYVALGAAPAPYPLGGEPEAVVEDVRRLGGFGLAAHPGSTKEGLKWRDWDAPFDGVEWLNADSEWRDRPRDLWRAFLAYPWRPTPAITALLDRPTFELGQWDRVAARRPLVGLAAHDAHARLGLRGVGEPYDGFVALDVPGYAAMFAAFSNLVRVVTPLSGDAAADGAAILQAMANGHVYAVISGVAPAGAVRFVATSGESTAGMGDYLSPSTTVTVDFAADVPAGARSTLVCDGRPVARSEGGVLHWSTAGAAGACRAEVSVGDEQRAPWLVTNPIYIRASISETAPRALVAPQLIVPLAGSGALTGWATEAAPGAGGTVTMMPGQSNSLAFTWRIGDGLEQFSAARFDTRALGHFDRLILRASADRPMRVWVQLRTPIDGGRRWGRSVYLDQTPREIPIAFRDLVPLDASSSREVPLADVTALLVVVDTVHARAGSTGIVRFSEWWLGR